MSTRVWYAAAIVLVLAGAGYLFFARTNSGAQAIPTLARSGELSSVAAQGDGTAAADLPVVQIRPAASILAEVSASGNIELISQRAVAAQVDGEVQEIAVKPGDVVAAGDVLVALDTVELERAAHRAGLDLEAAKVELDQVSEASDPSDVAAAEADLAEARENLADILAGPSAEELAAARSTLASAQAQYEELTAGASDAELTQLSADLRKKQVALAQAQGDYDEIAWRNDAGMSSEAATLQETTIDYESALAAFEEATEPASASDLAAAESDIQNAQHALDDLLNSPTEAEIAQARAQVAQAEAALVDLQTGPSELDLSAAQIALEKAVVDLEEAYNNLSHAQIVAPIAGTVLAVNVEVGERVSGGTVVVTLADTSQLELTIDVAEIDIANVQAGQPATIEIDALPGRKFDGIVGYVAPASEEDSDLVNYPVTIFLDTDSLDGVRPGMTAVATLVNTSQGLEYAWLVPNNAIRQGAAGAEVTVVRGGATQAVPVQVGNAQGEWIVVQSQALQAGDQVVGSLAESSEGGFPFGPPGGGFGVPGGGGRRPGG